MASSLVSRGGKIGPFAQCTLSDHLIASFEAFDPTGTDLKLPLLHPHRRRRKRGGVAGKDVLVCYWYGQTGAAAAVRNLVLI